MRRFLLHKNQSLEVCQGLRLELTDVDVHGQAGFHLYHNSQTLSHAVPGTNPAQLSFLVQIERLVLDPGGSVVTSVGGRRLVIIHVAATPNTDCNIEYSLSGAFAIE